MAINTEEWASCGLLFYFPTWLNISIQELSLSCHNWFAKWGGGREIRACQSKPLFPSGAGGSPFRASGGPVHEAARARLCRRSRSSLASFSSKGARRRRKALLIGRARRGRVWRAFTAGVPLFRMAAGEEALEGLDGASLEELMEKSFVEEPPAER